MVDGCSSFTVAAEVFGGFLEEGRKLDCFHMLENETLVVLQREGCSLLPEAVVGVFILQEGVCCWAGGREVCNY